MQIRNPNTLVQVVLLTSALWLSAVATAGLKEKPPKGVALTGTWQIDPYRSDDPKTVLDKALDDSHESSGDGHATRGIFGGNGGTWGGSGSGGEGTWGRDDSDFPGRGGGGRHGGTGRRHGNDSSSSSADGSKQSDWSHDQLAELSVNPEKLSFESVNQNLRVTAGEISTECAAGVKAAISDVTGEAERNCGWDGRAWVIETTRANGFMRTDRYEMSKDGGTITYLTTASAPKLPTIKISRTYIH